MDADDLFLAQALLEEEYGSRERAAHLFACALAAEAHPMRVTWCYLYCRDFRPLHEGCEHTRDSTGILFEEAEQILMRTEEYAAAVWPLPMPRLLIPRELHK